MACIVLIATVMLEIRSCMPNKFKGAIGKLLCCQNIYRMMLVQLNC